jgi:radical S-adenosyl methionine domain-containing protein 2
MNHHAIRPPVPALNFHVWQPCNMGCRYCFAEFSSTLPQLRRDKSVLRERAIAVVREAADAGIEKITVVGGEPTLCPWLGDLLKLAADLGMVTMVVTNGSKLNERWLDEHDRWTSWVAISVDSLHPEVNRRLGRTVGDALVPDGDFYCRLLESLADRGIQTKVNTVVSSLNWQEDFTEFLQRCRPKRWKALQALHIAGENDAAFPQMACTEDQFRAFQLRHAAMAEPLMLAAEDNDAMLGSYLMIDPLCRFFSNADRRHRYSMPIWQVGWHTALAQVQVNADKFAARGGLYDWGRRSSR